MHRRILKSPSAGSTILKTVNIEEGGTGATNANQALANLGALSASLYNQPNGVAQLGADKFIKQESLPSGITSIINIQGDTSILANETKQYIITDYDVFTDYVITTINGGSITQNKEILTYTAPLTSGQHGFIINGYTIPIEVLPSFVLAPNIEAPVNNATTVNTNYTFVSSAFLTNSIADTHDETDWEIATDPEFTNIVFISYNDKINKTSWNVNNLLGNVVYYIRVRYRGINFGWSEWSAVTKFTTVETVVVSKPTITSISASGSSGVSINVTSFALSSGSDVFSSLECMRADDSAFTTNVRTITSNINSHCSVSSLVMDTCYYFKVRYKSSRNIYSEWSDVQQATISEEIYWQGTAYYGGEAILGGLLTYYSKSPNWPVGWYNGRRNIFQDYNNRAIKQVNVPTPMGHTQWSITGGNAPDVLDTSQAYQSGGGWQISLLIDFGPTMICVNDTTTEKITVDIGSLQATAVLYRTVSYTVV